MKVDTYLVQDMCTATCMMHVCLVHVCTQEPQVFGVIC